MGLLGSADRGYYMGDVYLWDIEPQCPPRRATNRSIHLESLTGRGHISKPEHQQIKPRRLYAYGDPKGPTRYRDHPRSGFSTFYYLRSRAPGSLGRFAVDGL